MRRASLLLVAAAACGPDPTTPIDAGAADAGVDAPGPDAGRCGVDDFFTAELLDWGSSDAAFLGVFGAAWTVAGDPARTATTAPNGRIELCLAPAASPRLDVDAPDTYLDAVVVVRPADLLVPQNLLAARLPTAPAYATFLGGFELAPVAGAAHVLAYFPVDTAAQALDHAHAPALAALVTAGAPAWAAGTTGDYVLFPNVEVGDGTTTLTGVPGVPVDVPLVADRLTIVNQVFALE